jgi:hypothetical protein
MRWRSSEILHYSAPIHEGFSALARVGAGGQIGAGCFDCRGGLEAPAVLSRVSELARNLTARLRRRAAFALLAVLTGSVVPRGYPLLELPS